LLETIRELNNINKSNKTKIDSHKKINEIKEQQIKDLKSEIKELKKEILNINKLLKKENQLNKKLIQNEENLKIQLEKEKMKNKILQSRVNSASKIKNNFQNGKNKKEISVNKKREKSQDILIKANAFVNQKKNEKSKDKKILNNSTVLNNKNGLGVNNIVWKNKEENKNYISQKSLTQNESTKKIEIENINQTNNQMKEIQGNFN
jgi:hypothetical protein